MDDVKIASLLLCQSAYICISTDLAFEDLLWVHCLVFIAKIESVLLAHGLCFISLEINIALPKSLVVLSFLSRSENV